jgi:hypothetical protein
MDDVILDRFALDGDNVAVTGLFSDHHNDLVSKMTDFAL